MRGLLDKVDRLKDLIDRDYEKNNLDVIDNDLNRIIKIKDQDDEIHETLLLIHSNYKTEIVTLRQRNYRYWLELMSILDHYGKSISYNNRAIEKYEKEIDKMEEKLMNSKKEWSFKEPRTWILMFAGAIFTMLLIFSLFLLNPDATKHMTSFTVEIAKVLRGDSKEDKKQNDNYNNYPTYPTYPNDNNQPPISDSDFK